MTDDDSPETPAASEPAPDRTPDPTPDAGNEPLSNDRWRNLKVTAAVAIALLMFFAIANELLPSSSPVFVEGADPFDDSPVVSSSARDLGTPAPSARSRDAASE